MQTIETKTLETITGGAAPDQAANQAQLRQLAQTHCPTTFNQFKGAKTITRPMAEQCLNEAGLGMFKGRLDQYFPPKQ